MKTVKTFNRTLLFATSEEIVGSKSLTFTEDNRILKGIVNGELFLGVNYGFIKELSPKEIGNIIGLSGDDEEWGYQLFPEGLTQDPLLALSSALLKVEIKNEEKDKYLLIGSI